MRAGVSTGFDTSYTQRQAIVHLPSSENSPFRSLGYAALTLPLVMSIVASASSGFSDLSLPLARRLSLAGRLCISGGALMRAVPAHELCSRRSSSSNSRLLISNSSRSAGGMCSLRHCATWSRTSSSIWLLISSSTAQIIRKNKLEVGTQGLPGTFLPHRVHDLILQQIIQDTWYFSSTTAQDGDHQRSLWISWRPSLCF